MNVKELRLKAKSMGLKGYSKIKKSELEKLTNEKKKCEKEKVLNEDSGKCIKINGTVYKKLEKLGYSNIDGIMKKKKFNPENLKKLIKYSRKISDFNKETRFFGIDSDVSEKDVLSHNPKGLDIENTIEKITSIYNKNDYIELRPYKGENKLIIGCGNKRLDNCNLERCESKSDKDKISKYHSHKDAYTIDMSLVANPSIVSDFNNKSNYKDSIPDNSFDLIIFEGGGDPLDNLKEIKRMLNKNNLSYCISNNHIYSFYREGDYYSVANK